MIENEQVVKLKGKRYHITPFKALNVVGIFVCGGWGWWFSFNFFALFLTAVEWMEFTRLTADTKMFNHILECNKTDIHIPENTRRSPNSCTILAHRLQRCPTFVPTLGERLVFLGIFY